jgi:hypothetical protein
LPLHLYQRHDPAEEDARDIAREDAAEGSVLTLDAPLEAPVAPQPATSRTHSVPVVPQRQQPAAPQRARGAAASRLSFTDYGYVIPELKRIFAVAAAVIVLLVLVAIIHG